MSLIINTNMASIAAQNNLTISNNKLQDSVERLSSGLRIVKAADDAAGLALSEKMRAK
ncbi:MAG: flagellin FliC, partial [Nitrospirae bacterium]|nr:flagellin FliC [Nitrospirota bacterium]